MSQTPESRPASKNPTPNPSRPASQTPSRAPSQASTKNPTPNQSRPASQNRAPSQASNNQSRPASRTQNSQSRPSSQQSNNKSRSVSQASRTSSPAVTRPPRTPRGRSRTTRSISSAGGSDEEEPAAAPDRASTPTAENPEPESELHDLDEEEGEGDAAVAGTGKGNGDGQGDEEKTADGKKKRRRRGKKTRGFGVDKWPHGDNPGKLERPHGVDDWPYGDDDEEGVGVSGRVLQRPKGIRDFSPAYEPEPSEAGSNSSRWTDRTDYSQVSGLSLGDWGSDLPGVDSWPHGDNPGIMIKPLDHFGNPLKNPDGTLMQKQNPTGLPTYDELHEMDLDSQEDHIIALKLEIDIDVAVEINARIHGDVTLALLM